MKDRREFLETGTSGTLVRVTPVTQVRRSKRLHHHYAKKTMNMMKKGK
jgi:hypothetical protein